MKALLTMGALALLLAACSSPHKVKKLDTEMTHTQDVVGGEVVGVKDGKAVVQQKVLMGEELRRLQIEAHQLEGRVYGGSKYLDQRGLYGALRDCYAGLARHTGELTPMPEPRNYVIPDNTRVIGLDEGDVLVGVTEEYLKDRIDRYNRYRSILRERQDEYENRLALCHVASRKHQDATAQ